MLGRHHIVLETKHLKYEFDICRNITIINGDSATGKTTMVGLLSEYARRQESSGIRLESDVPCAVYNGASNNWKMILDSYQSTILFFDEGYDFIYTADFAKAIQATDNYYVFITRKPMKNLAYSTKEIYGIRTTGKYHFPEQAYHEFYPLINEKESLTEIHAEKQYVLLVEDTKAGYQFFSSLTGSCVGVGGNSGFYKAIQSVGKDKQICVIADGAAFGAFINDNLELRRRGYDLSVYLPESFEWIILKSGVVTGDNMKAVLEKPEEYIESREFFSWERFFTNYLIECTKDDRIKRYSKDRLSRYYMSPQVSSKVVVILPTEIKNHILPKG